MKITKQNWPVWALCTAAISYLMMITVFDRTYGTLAWVNYLLFAIAVFGSLPASIATLIRTSKRGLILKNEQEARGNRIKRQVEFILALVFTLAVAYFLVTYLVLLLGFLTLGNYQKVSY